jgi:thiamine kinase-like enzyme
MAAAHRAPPAAAAGWRTVADDPKPFLGLGIASAGWLEKCLGDLLSAEAECSVDGSAMTHFDVRSDNLCLAGTGMKLVDWAEARAGNPALDLGFWLPSLAHEGGPLPEAVLPDAPAVAAWVAGYFAARAGLADIADAPRVRSIQRAQLATALPWAARALGLPPS